MMRLRGKNIFYVARSEYVKWLMNPRMVILLVVLVPVREIIILPVIRAAKEMGQPLNMFETGIAAANSSMVILLLPLAYLVLISSFPTVDGNMLFYIERMGRKNWILGEMLFQAFAAATYCVAMTAAVLVQTAHMSFLANGWSIVVTDYDMVYEETSNHMMAAIVPPNLYYQMPPYKALFFSYFLLFLYLMLCTMVFLMGSLYGKKLLFFFLLIVQISVGSALFILGSKWMWLFPACHAILRTHYHDYLRRYVFSPWLSVSIFAVLLAVFAIINFRRATKVNLA